MPLNMYSTAVLNRVLRDLKFTPSFLLDTFFPGVITEESEEIHFDAENKKFRLSPFVSPLAEGQIVESLGAQEKILKPAYIKDKRQYNPNRAVKRGVGEGIGGSMSAEERMRASIRMDMEDQIEMLTRRMEWMASAILRTGAVTLQGAKYPLTLVNFGRTAGHTIVLTGGQKWDQAGVDPLNDLETWAQLVFGNSGSLPTTVVMDPKAWAVFRKNTAVQAQLDLYRTTSMEPSLRSDVPITTGGVLMGRINYFSIYAYAGNYHDDTLVSQKFLPDGTVILANASDLQGARVFGAIRDVRNLHAVPFYIKSWTMEDPSIEWTMMQSAPLTVPFRVDASLCATVI